MKNTTKLIIAFVLSALSFAATAQVKQVFKVVDFNTKRPIAGATSSLYGQTLTTDAKGVAVANLNADQKGAYLPLEKWVLDGYALIGRAPVSYYKDFQTSDTIFFQMVPRQDIRKEQQELTVQFFRWWNDHYVMEYVNNVLKDIRDNPDEASSLAYSMTEDAANTRLMFISDTGMPTTSTSTNSVNITTTPHTPTCCACCVPAMWTVPWPWSKAISTPPTTAGQVWNGSTFSAL